MNEDKLFYPLELNAIKRDDDPVYDDFGYLVRRMHFTATSTGWNVSYKGYTSWGRTPFIAIMNLINALVEKLEDALTDNL